LAIFFKNTQISNFMKICLVGVELLHADRQTDTHTRMDTMKPIATFCNFATMPTNHIYPFHTNEMKYLFFYKLPVRK